MTTPKNGSMDEYGIPTPLEESGLVKIVTFEPDVYPPTDVCNPVEVCYYHPDHPFNEAPGQLGCHDLSITGAMVRSVVDRLLFMHDALSPGRIAAAPGWTTPGRGTYNFTEKRPVYGSMSGNTLTITNVHASHQDPRNIATTIGMAEGEPLIYGCALTPGMEVRAGNDGGGVNRATIMHGIDFGETYTVCQLNREVPSYTGTINLYFEVNPALGPLVLPGRKMFTTHRQVEIPAPAPAYALTELLGRDGASCLVDLDLVTVYGDDVDITTWFKADTSRLYVMWSTDHFVTLINLSKPGVASYAIDYYYAIEPDASDPDCACRGLWSCANNYRDWSESLGSCTTVDGTGIDSAGRHWFCSQLNAVGTGVSEYNPLCSNNRCNHYIRMLESHCWKPNVADWNRIYMGKGMVTYQSNPGDPDTIQLGWAVDQFPGLMWQAGMQLARMDGLYRPLESYYSGYWGYLSTDVDEDTGFRRFVAGAITDGDGDAGVLEPESFTPQGDVVGAELDDGSDIYEMQTCLSGLRELGYTDLLANGAAAGTGEKYVQRLFPRKVCLRSIDLTADARGVVQTFASDYKAIWDTDEGTPYLYVYVKRQITAGAPAAVTAQGKKVQSWSITGNLLTLDMSLGHETCEYYFGIEEDQTFEYLKGGNAVEAPERRKQHNVGSADTYYGHAPRFRRGYVVWFPDGPGVPSPILGEEFVENGEFGIYGLATWTHPGTAWTSVGGVARFNDVTGLPIYKTLDVTVGHTYRLTFWLGGDGAAKLGSVHFGGVTVASNLVPAVGGTDYSYDVTVTSAASPLEFYGFSLNQIDLDNVSVREMPPPRIPVIWAQAHGGATFTGTVDGVASTTQPSGPGFPRSTDIPPREEFEDYRLKCDQVICCLGGAHGQALKAALQANPGLALVLEGAMAGLLPPAQVYTVAGGAAASGKALTVKHIVRSGTSTIVSSETVTPDVDASNASTDTGLWTLRVDVSGWDADAVNDLSIAGEMVDMQPTLPAELITGMDSDVRSLVAFQAGSWDNGGGISFVPVDRPLGIAYFDPPTDVDGHYVFSSIAEWTPVEGQSDEMEWIAQYSVDGWYGAGANIEGVLLRATVSSHINCTRLSNLPSLPGAGVQAAYMNVLFSEAEYSHHVIHYLKRPDLEDDLWVESWVTTHPDPSGNISLQAVRLKFEDGLVVESQNLGGVDLTGLETYTDVDDKQYYRGTPNVTRVIKIIADSPLEPDEGLYFYLGGKDNPTADATMSGIEYLQTWVESCAASDGGHGYNIVRNDMRYKGITLSGLTVYPYPDWLAANATKRGTRGNFVPLENHAE